MTGRVVLHPAVQEVLNSHVLTGMWAYPQPAPNLRAKQDALLEMGLAELVAGPGREKGRQFVRLTDLGLANVTGLWAEYARSKIGKR